MRARLRLFCFPYAGGGAAIFRPWASGLPPTVEIYTAHLPGREDRLREAAFTNLFDAVEALGREIVPYLDKPFAFFGHSMGAMISFELARELRRIGAPVPSHLYVSGRRAPQLPSCDPITHDLPHDQLVEELRRLNGTPAEILDHPEIMELMMPVLRSDFSVVETYSYRSDQPLNCAITALGGLADVEVTRANLDAWREQTAGRFSLHMLPGDHFFINTHRQLLLRILAQELHRCSVAAGAC